VQAKQKDIVMGVLGESNFAFRAEVLSSKIRRVE
jgi:hypothetical protein